MDVGDEREEKCGGYRDASHGLDVFGVEVRLLGLLGEEARCFIV
tara:strand:- start:44 stop:175 length:132 start_codon:yes stop_codon:yes gene_type:complete